MSTWRMPATMRPDGSTSLDDAARIMTVDVVVDGVSRVERRMLTPQEVLSAYALRPIGSSPQVGWWGVPFSPIQLEAVRDTHFLLPVLSCRLLRRLQNGYPLVYSRSGETWWWREVCGAQGDEGMVEWWLLPLHPMKENETIVSSEPAPACALLLDIEEGYRLPTTQAMVSGLALYCLLRGQRLFHDSMVLTQDAYTHALEGVGYFSSFGTMRVERFSSFAQHHRHAVHIVPVPEPTVG